jgi:hypothetical protein
VYSQSIVQKPLIANKLNIIDEIQTLCYTKVVVNDFDETRVAVAQIFFVQNASQQFAFFNVQISRF